MGVADRHSEEVEWKSATLRRFEKAVVRNSFSLPQTQDLRQAPVGEEYFLADVFVQRVPSGHHKS